MVLLAVAFPASVAALTLNPTSITSYTNFRTIPADGFPNQGRVGDFYRHALVFDLSDVDDPIVGATLRFESGFGTMVSIQSTRTYTVFDVATPIEDFARRIHSGPAASYYADFGSGVQYGATTFAVRTTNGANPLPSPEVVVDLPNALSDLNAARGGLFALAGTSPQTFNMFVNGRDLSQVTLSLSTEMTAVPIPATGPLLLAALALVWRIRRPVGRD